MKKTILLLLMLSLIPVLFSCESNETERVTRQNFAFDTLINITTDKKDEDTLDSALQECMRYELVFSRTNSKSELYSINEGGRTVLSEDMKAVLDFSMDFSEKSGGAFDVTVAPLVSLWDVNKRTAPPTEEEIADALKNVGYKEVRLSPFSAGGRQIDLGAVAKGYIADKLIEYFKQNNVSDVIVDLGGNVALIGEYTVGIRNPFSPDEVFATIKLKDKSAVTSGAYQRYFEYEGKQYHHIIDPRTGKCADSGIASVTVISPSSMQADALSTAIYVLGEEALSLCDNFPDTSALIITDGGEVVTTDGFAEKYNLHIN